MRKYISDIIITGCLLLAGANVFAQTTQTRYYTTKDGLPSNSIYKCVLDRHGFLWIATDNGLARFDGKNFKTYTTAQGLPDNEITDLFIDNDGRIWVTPFRRRTAYYNPVNDRFVNEDEDPALKTIELGNANRGSILKYGGMVFSNNNRDYYIYKNGTVTAYKNLLDRYIAGALVRVVEFKPDKYILLCADSARVMVNGKFISAYPLENKMFYSEYLNNYIYLSIGNIIRKYAVDEEGGLRLVVEKQFPFDVRIFCITGKSLAVATVNLTTYPVDTATLELRNPLMYNVAVRSVLEDQNGNVWLSTIDHGLIKMQQKRISSFTLNDKVLNEEITQNFNTLVKTNRKILAGSNYGELIIYDGIYDIKKRSPDGIRNIDGTVRKIIDGDDQVFVSSQTTSYLLNKSDYKITRRFKGANNFATKAAHRVNDSILLVGSHSMARKYNLKTNTITDSIVKRVTAFGTDAQQQVYIGSNDGFYRWSRDSLIYYGDRYKGLSYRVNSIFNTADNLIWVGLGSDSLMVLQNDKLIRAIALGDIIPGNVCKSLYSNSPGIIWLGTNKGLNKIEYRLNSAAKKPEGVFSFSNTFFGLSDGLIGEQVNDITIYRDTVYVATSGGISFLPANLHLPISDITTFITRVSIHGSDTLVLKEYTLPYDKNDINIYFSGADLTGYYPLFEYRVNDANWLKTDKNNIELSLAPGKYKIQIRGIKRDGTPSAQSETISVTVKTPFWKNGFFWAVLGIAVFIISFFVLEKSNRQKRKVEVEKVITEKKLTELEMQALKAQINPHFVFNCLNSIKGFIIDRDYKQADKYLDKFSDLMRSTVDNSDASIISLRNEISYLDNYLQLEKLRFDEKFDYEIKVEEPIDVTEVFVPAMLLQPYVENAIRHGMRFLEDRYGMIYITLAIVDRELVCTIDDNGIGREKAKALKSEMHIEYQGRGMSISNRRAELYKIEQQVIDKSDPQGLPAGTTVVLKIPLNLKA